MRVGIIGIGTIGSYLVQRIAEDKSLALGFVFDTDKEKVKGFPAKNVVNSIEEACNRNIDLVVECASHRAVIEYAPKILRKCDLLVLSVSALAFKETETAIREACKKSGRHLFVPSGAIIGIDGISAVRHLLKSVELVSRKPPKGFGRSDKDEKVLFEGSAREACRLFPKNVNISATLALNGIGFDKTKVKIISDPKARSNVHKVEAEGSFGKFHIVVESRPSKNPATSSTAAISAFDTIKKIQLGISIFREN